VNAVDRWTDPGTAQAYPFAYEAYRRLREAQDKPLPRHQILGGQVDHHVWRRWCLRRSSRVDVLLTLRGETSPRVRRMVAAILASIRRGRAPEEAIRLTSKRFGLPQSRIRACLAASMRVDLQRREASPWASGDVPSFCPLGDWA
jgi:hypothetical protein